MDSALTLPVLEALLLRPPTTANANTNHGHGHDQDQDHEDYQEGNRADEEPHYYDHTRWFHRPRSVSRWGSTTTAPAPVASPAWGVPCFSSYSNTTTTATARSSSPRLGRSLSLNYPQRRTRSSTPGYQDSGDDSDEGRSGLFSSQTSRSRSRGRTFQRRTASLRGVSLEPVQPHRSNSLSVRADLQDANPPLQRQALQALDLCGCVSQVFQLSLTQFVERYLTPPPPPPPPLAILPYPLRRSKSSSSRPPLTTTTTATTATSTTYPNAGNTTINEMSATERPDRLPVERRGRSRTRTRLPGPLPDAVTEESGEESEQQYYHWGSASLPPLLPRRSTTYDAHAGLRRPDSSSNMTTTTTTPLPSSGIIHPNHHPHQHHARAASVNVASISSSSSNDQGGLRSRSASISRGNNHRPTMVSRRPRSISQQRRTRSQSRSHGAERSWTPIQLSNVERLGLAGVRAPIEVLHTFTLAFPRLTHLDLSGTLITDSLLVRLVESRTLHLDALGLAECKLLSSRAITDLLLSLPCKGLTQLSLKRTSTDGPALTKSDLNQLLRTASFLQNGKMTYLDLGGCGMEDPLLELVPPQPSLLDLGLSHSPYLSLGHITHWIQTCAPRIQVLDLAFTADRAPHGLVTATKLYTMLLGPLAEPTGPTLAEQLAWLNSASINGTNQSSSADVREEMQWEENDGDCLPTTTRQQAATDLQVVGLSPAVLHTIGGGIGTWRTIQGAGNRGWAVDTAAATTIHTTHTTPTPTPPTSITTSLHPSSHPPAPLDSTSTRKNTSSTTTPSYYYDPDTTDTTPTAGSRVSGRVTVNNPLQNGGVLDDLVLGSRPSSPARYSVCSPTSTTPAPPPATATTQVITPTPPTNTTAANVVLVPTRTTQVFRNLPDFHPQVQALRQLADNEFNLGSTGWHSHKMEIVRAGLGFLGREEGSYAHVAYARR